MLWLVTITQERAVLIHRSNTLTEHVICRIFLVEQTRYVRSYTWIFIIRCCCHLSHHIFFLFPRCCNVMSSYLYSRLYLLCTPLLV